MACFTAAIACLILLQMQGQARSEVNVAGICSRLERIDGEPCALVQPSATETRLFAFLRR